MLWHYAVGDRPSRDRRAEGRNAWLALGSQREFCTATTGFLRKYPENTLRHNSIYVGIASAAAHANGRAERRSWS